MGSWTCPPSENNEFPRAGFHNKQVPMALDRSSRVPAKIQLSWLAKIHASSFYLKASICEVVKLGAEAIPPPMDTMELDLTAL